MSPLQINPWIMASGFNERSLKGVMQKKISSLEIRERILITGTPAVYIFPRNHRGTVGDLHDTGMKYFELRTCCFFDISRNSCQDLMMCCL